MRDAESRAARESERAIRCWPRPSRRASSVAAAVSGQIRVRRDPARRHGEEAAYACVRAAHPFGGARAARARKKKKEARRAHRLTVNTASLWMLALMERNLAAAYIESPQQSRAPRLLAIAEANGKRRSRPLAAEFGVRNARRARRIGHEILSFVRDDGPP